jgi:DNA-binding response OmpR family regulator
VRVLVLADDLIWSTRLAALVRSGGADAVTVRSLAALGAGIADADAVIVDLTARAYDGIEAIRAASAAGRRVLAVGQHDDAELRKRALQAGAERVHPYRKLFDRGPETLAAWLDPEGEATAR